MTRMCQSLVRAQLGCDARILLPPAQVGLIASLKGEHKHDIVEKVGSKGGQPAAGGRATSRGNSGGAVWSSCCSK